MLDRAGKNVDALAMIAAIMVLLGVQSHPLNSRELPASTGSGTVLWVATIGLIGGSSAY